MGRIASATTVFATAYLTELGRQYLFNAPKKPRFKSVNGGQAIDLLKIERFSLGDPDVNYNLPFPLESGDIPDLSGENEGCVTGAKGRTLNNLISPKEATFSDPAEVTYTATKRAVRFDLGESFANLPTVVTQQLQTFLDNVPTTDGSYTLTPTNYGPNQLEDNVLTIPLQTATANQPGYRMRIFFPSIGANYNKVTIQFERGTFTNATVLPGSGPILVDNQTGLSLNQTANVQTVNLGGNFTGGNLPLGGNNNPFGGNNLGIEEPGQNFNGINFGF